MTTTTVAERARVEWSTRLSSAIRATFAYAIVGGATLYGPKFLAHHIKFSAFSYFTTALIVSGAVSLGDAVRGCWHAFCATLTVVPLAMLWRWIIGPTDELPPSMAAAGVAVGAFLVAAPGFTHLMSKKIGFGQIILVCTVAGVNGGPGDRFMQPLYIAASTALGGLASVLAFLVPYPSLASYKLRELCRIYAENSSQRTNIYLKAFTAPDEHTKMALLSQATPLSETGAKLLQSIKISQEGMQWERPWRRAGRAGPTTQRLEKMELQMRGMEYSLLSNPTFHLQTSQVEQISHLLETISSKLKEKMQQIACFSPSNSIIQSESIEKPPSLLNSTFPTPKQGSIFLFFSCIDTILNDDFTSPDEDEPHPPKTESATLKTLIHERLEFSIKCSISLSLGVFLGLLFDPDHGCYAGLAIAISFVDGRQAIFTMANARAQGTAMGSVYGVICCFLFRHEIARLLAVLPWVAVASLIRHSKMYGQTGEISAAVGALLILGRKNYGPPNEFAIARLVQVFIGLTAFIAVELLLQPFRAATLTENRLQITLNALPDCIKETGTRPKTTKRNRTKLDSLVSTLNETVGDAELEPDFWYLPFRTSSYQKVLKSLSNVRDLYHFVTHSFEAISELLDTTNPLRDELKEQINDETRLLRETLNRAVSTGRKEVIDLEGGVLRNNENVTVFITEQKEDNHLEEIQAREMVMRQMSATEFCISSIMKELESIQICMMEINQWENKSNP